MDDATTPAQFWSVLARIGEWRGGITPHAVCRQSGIFSGSIEGWRHGTGWPSIGSLQKIAIAFDVTFEIDGDDIRVIDNL